MDGSETTTRRELLWTDGLGAVSAATIRRADATRYVDDLSVRAEPR
ncbi:hypothetical protein [Halorubrum sp. GN11_10-6_MGM]|nr:hypothetical protein [Halorubrum sp. GN11_10-6_MGM]